MYQYILEHASDRIPALPPTPVLSTDPEVVELTKMLASLKSAIRKVEPIKYPFMTLSSSDIFENSASSSCGRFELAAHQADFELLRSCVSASRAALYYHYIEDCFDETGMDETCRPDLKTLLSVLYSSLGLEATLLKRHEGMLEISSQDLDVDFRADSVSRRGDPVRYRKSVKDFVGRYCWMAS